VLYTWDPSSTEHFAAITKYLEQLIAIEADPSYADPINLPLGDFIWNAIQFLIYEEEEEFKNGLPKDLPPELRELKLDDWGDWTCKQPFEGRLQGGFIYVYRSWC
jgi:hypothetical protein